MSTARRVFSGAAWLYGAQIGSVLAQVGYAALTSRLVGASAFGEYGVALTATALLTLLAAGGLAQTVGRMQHLDRRELGSATSYSLLLGLAVAVLTFSLAIPLANLWGVPGAGLVIQLLAINALTAPFFGVVVGLMRRTGTFKQLAILTLASNVVGMIVGLVAVSLLRSAASLAVSAIVAQSLVVLSASIAVRRHIRLSRIMWTGDAVGFTWRVTGSALVQYVVGNATKFSVSRTLGAATVGQWNRAEVLSTMPFQQLQQAMIQALYPEFRHDRDTNDRARALWPDLLGIVAWLTWPLGAVAAVVVPVLLPILFGPGWEAAALFAVPLALAGGIQPTVMLLYSAIESLGRFKPIWVMNGVLVALQIGLAVMIVALHSPWPALFSVLVNNVVGHAILLGWAHRARYVDIPRLLLHYAGAGSTGLVTAALVGGLVVAISTGDLVFTCVALGVLLLATATAAVFWRRLPPVRLAIRLGLLGHSS